MKPAERIFHQRLGLTFAAALRRRGWRINRYEEYGRAGWVHPSGFEADSFLLRDVFLLLVALYPARLP